MRSILLSHNVNIRSVNKIYIYACVRAQPLYNSPGEEAMIRAAQDLVHK